MQVFKYHGAGNDFILIDATETEIPGPPDELAIRLCHRRLGLGADGILLLGPSDQPGSDVAMRIYNSDGSEAEMCGNGLRCLVKHVLDEDLVAAGPTLDNDPNVRSLTVETGTGALACAARLGDDGRVRSVRIDMGKPILERSRIPVAGEGSGVREEIAHPDGETFGFTAVSMGNPHAIIFVDSGEPAGLARRWGPALERHERFPAKANISFVRSDGPNHLRAAVYERGAGLTAACGTGACAIGVAAGLEDRIPWGEAITVALPGGELGIDVAEDGSTVFLTGPAVRVATLHVDLNALASVEACQALTSLIE